MRDDKEALNAEMVGQRQRVRRELHPAAGWVRGITRAAEGAMVEGDAAIPLPEERHLLPPAHTVAALSVREQDRWPFTVRLVVQFNAIDRRKRHLRPPDPPLSQRSIR